MISHPLTASFRTGIAFVALAATLTGGSGCAHLATFYNGVLVRVQEKHELANVRQDTRQALAQQEQDAQRQAAAREVEQARLNAERQRMEMELCRANQEALQQQVRNNLKNVLESKVAFNVEHGLEVGELEVDTEALQQLLKAREQAPPTSPLTSPLKGQCSCCDRPCNCGSGFLRRFCPHCRNKPCEAENNCGGPAEFARLQQAPLKQPLRPAEIPMKLPVRLTYGFQQPSIESARVRTQPITSAPVTSPVTGMPCTQGVGPCTQGSCPCPYHQGYVVPETSAPVAGLPPRDQYLDTTGASTPPPPQPAPDNEARRLRPSSIPAIQLQTRS